MGPRVMGVVCSMKDSFGFIERADVVKEIFFHYSEYQAGNVGDLQLGDDVEFNVAERNVSRSSYRDIGDTQLPYKTTANPDTAQSLFLFLLLGQRSCSGDREAASGNSGVRGRGASSASRSRDATSDAPVLAQAERSTTGATRHSSVEQLPRGRRITVRGQGPTGRVYSAGMCQGSVNYYHYQITSKFSSFYLL